MSCCQTSAAPRNAFALGLLLAAALVSPRAVAQSAGEDPPVDRDVAEEAEATDELEDASPPKLADRIRAVERKLFLKKNRFELLPYVGLDINDAFFQHFFVGAAASYHLADSLALEVRGGFAFAELTKSSVTFVRLDADALIERAPSLVAHADANVVFAPVYGKLSLFGESILHFDTFLTAGGGVFVSERPRRADDGLVNDTNVNPAVNLGIGQRYFLNEWLVVRLELRNYLYEETGPEGDLRNVTLIGLALSGFLPTTFEYENP